MGRSASFARFLLLLAFATACGTRFPAQDPKPRIGRVYPDHGPAAGGTLLVVEGLAFDKNAKVYFGEKEAARVTWVSALQLTAQVPAGTGDALVSVVNPDGLRAEKTQGFSYTDAAQGAAPTLTKITPAAGPATGGTMAELWGTGLQEGALVFVGGRPARDPVAVNDTLVTTVLPQAEPGVADVALTNPDGQTVVLEKAFSYAESFNDPAPLITGILPKGASAAGGTKGTLTGANFNRGARVYIGGRPSPSVFQSETLLEITIPEGKVGLASVGVTNPDGQSDYRPQSFSYYSPGPLLTLITPEFGPIAGGAEVTLVGGNFEADTVVTFGKKPAETVTVENARLIKAVSPPGATWGPTDIGVKNRDGQEDVRSGIYYYFDADHPPPGQGTGPGVVMKVDRVLPTSGSSTGGTLVMITGAGFQAGTKVSFGGTDAPDVRVLSGRALSVRTPAVRPGLVDIVVTAPDNSTQSLKASFSFFDAASTADAPVVAGITPATGPATGGTRGLIAGRNFVQGARLYFGEVQAAKAVVVDAQRITFTTPSVLPGLVDVVVINPDGKSARLTLGYAFYVGDGAGPQITEVAPPSAPAGDAAKVVINGAQFQPGAQLFVDDTPASDVVVTNGAQMGATIPPFNPGAFAITVTNPDGRSVTKAGGFSYTTPTPRADKIVPALGPTAGGVKVLVQGANFLDGATVSFGGTPSASVVFVGPDALLATAPAGQAGKVDVVVQNPGGGAEARLSQAFEYREGYQPQAPPTLTQLVPPTGPTSGGTVLALRGTNFLDGMVVLFGHQAARRVLLSSATEAVVVAPPGVAGAVDVSVVNPDGNLALLSGGFRYVDPSTLGGAPVLTGVIPKAGPETHPTDLLLTGRRFDNGVMVFVGRFVSSFVRRDSDTLVSSRAPVGQVGAVDVAVTNPDGQSSLLEGAFTYKAAPKVTSVDPVEAPDSGGKLVQVFGEAFEADSRVYFGDTPATTTSFIGPTLLTAVAPAHVAGPVDVLVTNPDGQEGVLEGGFTFRAPPRVVALFPAQGAVTGGSIVAVTGLDFRQGAKVLFDGVEVEAGFGDARTIAIKTPRGTTAGNSVTVTVVNPDGQRHDLTAGFTWTDPALFTTPGPTLTAVKPGSGPDKGGTWALLSGTNLDSQAIAFVGNRLMSAVKVSFAKNLTGVVPGGPRGDVRVAVTNPDGRSAELAPGFTFVDPAGLGQAPSVVSINPQAGITRGGETVSIGGTNFAQGDGELVLLAGFPAASSHQVAANTLGAVTGPGVIGQGDVVVTNPDGQSAALSTAWMYQATAPSVAADGLTPNSGPTRGGTLVVLTGNDFEFGATVRFGTTQATSVKFVSSTRLEARTPPGPIGKVDVTVENPGGKSGTAAQAFEFVPPPVILSITPSSGPQAGNTTIAINGRYFRGTPRVKVGGNDAAQVTLQSDTVLTAVTPPGTGSAGVQVINGDGQTADFSSGFVYLASIQPPTIIAVSPDYGDAAGDTYVTIVGSGFSAGAQVFFGQNQATGVQVNSDGAITARTPAGAENTRVDLTVKNPPFPGGTSVTKSGAFLYTPGRQLGQIGVTFVQPSQGPCAGGTEILVGGQGFKNGAKVYVNGVEQDNSRVYGPTAIVAVTKAYGDPANCTKTPLTVRVQNPTLELAELANGFTYVGGNRRFDTARGDRVPAESWNYKSDQIDTYYGTRIWDYAQPVIAPLTNSQGGGHGLSDILIGRWWGGSGDRRTREGGFLYYAPAWDTDDGALWNDNGAQVFKYDPACGTAANRVRPIGRDCAMTGYEPTNNVMTNPVVADFDKNGDPDVLYFERRDRHLYILYNIAGKLVRYDLGSFPAYGDTTTATTFCSGTGSAKVCGTGSYTGHAVGDFDLDGRLDIAVSTLGVDFIVRNENDVTSGAVEDFTKKGWRTWDPSGAGTKLLYPGSSPNPTGDYSMGLAVADIDKDGDQDIMVINYNQSVRTYLNNRAQPGIDGNTFNLRDAAGAPFGEATAWTGRTRAITLADYDKDGDPDLMITHERAQDEYWVNNGSGQFTRETTSTPSCAGGRRLPAVADQAIFRVQNVDLDADGDLDLVEWLDQTCASCSVPRQIRVYRNDSQPNTNNTRAGCFVDMTSDFLPTTGDGAPEINANGFAVGDLDGDGYPDAVFAGDDRKQVRTYLNVLEGGKRVLRDRTRLRLPNRWPFLTVGAAFADVDGDGDKDLIVSSTDSGLPGGTDSQTGADLNRGSSRSRTLLYLNNGLGRFTDAPAGNWPVNQVYASRIVTGDVDGDGDLDVLLPNFTDLGTPAPRRGDYKLFINDGHGRFSDESYPRLPIGEASNRLYGRAASLVDWDGDGDLDIVAGAGFGCTRFWENRGDGYFIDITSSAAPWMPSIAGCQDGRNRYSFYWGGVYDQWTPNTPESFFVREVLPSDFDLNGTVDLFIGRENVDSQLLLSCKDPVTGRPVFYNQPPTPCSPSPANAPLLPTGGSYAVGAAVIKRQDGDKLVSDVVLYQSRSGKTRIYRGSRTSPGRLADDTPIIMQPSIPPGYRDLQYVGLLASPFDYDNDGDLDFFLSADPYDGINTGVSPGALVSSVAGLPRVLRYSVGSIVDVAQEPTPFNPLPFLGEDHPFGSIAADVDGDGWDDLFVMNRYNARLLLSRP